MTAIRTTAAALIAATIGATALTAPASAGGSFSVDIAPASADSANAMRAGMQIYSLFNDVRSGGSIRQNGSGNAAGLEQRGSGNVGIVHQEGDGHNGTLRQQGNGNAYGLFQFGRGTNGHVRQSGNGGTGMTFQWGW